MVREHFADSLAKRDPDVARLVASEALRQDRRLELIASDNYVSRGLLDALGSVFENTTVEGYPGERFHGPSPEADALENLAIERACQLFGSKFANVQPHSGTQANQAVFLALLASGDTVLSMSLSAGGHFSHGTAANICGLWVHSVHYGVRQDDGLLDYDEVEQMAKTHRPKLLIAGASAYPRTIDFQRLADIAAAVGAMLMVDIAHVAGLVANQFFPNPFPYADVVTSTTYKNLRGARGGVILTNDADLAKKIDEAVCPGVQGVPLVGSIAAKAVAFGEALRPEYRQYCAQVLANSRALAAGFLDRRLPILTGGTDTPFVVVDVRPYCEHVTDVVVRLDSLNIGVNAVFFPGDPPDFSRASGIRIGTSAITTRGMAEAECVEIVGIVSDVLETMKRDDRSNSDASTAKRVAILCERFPTY